MADDALQARMAALKAKRTEASNPPDATAEMPAASPVVEILHGPGDRLRSSLSSARTVTAGTSIVSFAAMVVAMGPILKTADDTAKEIVASDDQTTADPAAEPLAGATAPTPPPVVIEVTAATAETATPAPSAEPTEPAAPPTTAPPTTAPPTAAAPTTAAPVTAAPATAAPTIASTTPPPTQPPQTQPPATDPLPPPKSESSG